MKILNVIPSLKITGGISEVIRFSNEIQSQDILICMLSLWRSPTEMESGFNTNYLSKWTPNKINAIFQLPILIFRFEKEWREKYNNDTLVIFNHYSTFLLSFFIKKTKRIYYVQGIEWEFFKNKLLSNIFKLIFIEVYKSGMIITTNKYISQRLTNEGINVNFETSIWANPAFLSTQRLIIIYDYIMVVAKPPLKRLDLYLKFIDLSLKNKMRVAVITTEDSIGERIRKDIDCILIRPTVSEMKNHFSRSKCFIHLSDSEGFGLPPLEAMGAGCIPICRDSGGVTTYMSNSPFSNNIIPKTMDIDTIFNFSQKIVNDPLHNYQRKLAIRHFKKGLMNSDRIRLSIIKKLQNHIKINNQINS
jgi:glycosyltransferase involved in cell wall biosynthesis